MGFSNIFQKIGSLFTRSGKNQAGKTDFNKIRKAIQTKYSKVSESAEGMFQYPVGRIGAGALGYDNAVLQNAPDELLESFCGVGNPFSLRKINEGDTILDIGCGAGFDVYVACHLTGTHGKVYGLDSTPEMAEKAKSNLSKVNLANLEIRVGNVEDMPFEDSLFDVVISNGVLNLSPHKDKAFNEIFRVMKPKGSFQFADIVLKEDLPPGLAGSAEAWSQ